MEARSRRWWHRRGTTNCHYRTTSPNTTMPITRPTRRTSAYCHSFQCKPYRSFSRPGALCHRRASIQRQRTQHLRRAINTTSRENGLEKFPVVNVGGGEIEVLQQDHQHLPGGRPLNTTYCTSTSVCGAFRSDGGSGGDVIDCAGAVNGGDNDDGDEKLRRVWTC